VALDLWATEVFVAVAEELHFGRAAERVHVTQPAVSQQIRKLEAALGVRLLERSNRHVALTHEGQVFLSAARDALAAGAHAVAAVRRAAQGESGFLRVASSGSLAGELASSLVQNFRARHPAADVTLSQYDFTRSLAGLPSADVDVALVRAPIAVPGVVAVPLVTERRVAVLSARHPIAKRAELRYADLAGEPLVVNAASTQPLRDFWAGGDLRGGRPYRVGASAGNLAEWLTALEDGAGVSLCPRSTQRFYSDRDLAFREVGDASDSALCLAWAGPRAFSLLARFVDTARRFVADARHPSWSAARP
jgi:DNA-binding transcriptional LysR family regulator